MHHRHLVYRRHSRAHLVNRTIIIVLFVVSTAISVLIPIHLSNVLLVGH